MAPKDSKADPVNGTLVQEVDSAGKRIENGFLEGKLFRTVSWTTRPSQEVGSACPIWIKNVVLSETLEGAKNGAALAGIDEALPSSSSTSKFVNAIMVDANGNKIKSKVYEHSLVRAIQAEPAPDGMAIASDLWFSMKPIDTSDPDIAKMANRCKGEGAGRGNP